jgi:transposase
MRSQTPADAPSVSLSRQGSLSAMQASPVGQQVSDYTGAAALMNDLPEAEWLLADRGYEADWFREALIDRGTKPCSPGRKSRKKTVKYDKRRYKRRTRIERMFGRLKDWRRVATRYHQPSSSRQSHSLQPSYFGYESRACQNFFKS